jgi:hypothetical protein
MYKEDEINAVKASPSFEREYNLKYLELIGNNFHIKNINSAIDKGQNFSHIEVNSYSQKSVELDPGFGSSAFGVLQNRIGRWRYRIGIIRESNIRN